MNRRVSPRSISWVAAAGLLAFVTACGDNRSPGSTADSVAVSRPGSGPRETAAPQATSAPDPEQPGATQDWRQLANADDRTRLARLDDAWRQALGDAHQAGFSDQVRALGGLADPNAGQAGRLQPPPGEYSCRTIKLGRIAEYGGYLAYPGFRCLVELTPGGDLILTKVTGSQRTRGRLYPDNARRLVFLGAQAWGAGETGYPEYGQQAERDQIGVLERIGDNRWRLALPLPKQESKLDLLELTR